LVVGNDLVIAAKMPQLARETLEAQGWHQLAPRVALAHIDTVVEEH
jgi:hypothetical protein